MDKLVRKIEVPLARNIVEKAGLYLVPKERIGELSPVKMQKVNVALLISLGFNDPSVGLGN